MNQPQSDERVTVEKILRLVEQLSPAELQELRRELSKSWGDRFRQLVQDVADDNEGSEAISDDEIADEVTNYRREKERRVLKVVVDANIWISALLNSNSALAVVRLLEHDQYQLICAEALVDELAEVLNRPKFLLKVQHHRKDRLLDLVREKAHYAL